MRRNEADENRVMRVVVRGKYFYVCIDAFSFQFLCFLFSFFLTLIVF